MKKIIGFVLSFALFFHVLPTAQASELEDINGQYKELYASDLSYVNGVYKSEGKKVKDIVGVSSEIKDALGEWTVVSVSKNGGSVNVGFEAIVLQNPDKAKNEYIISYKGSAGSLTDKDWKDNTEAISKISTDLTQKTGVVYHPQDADAVLFTQSILSKYKGATFTLTGHSLGGHLAQRSKIDLKLEGTKVVTFNSLGVVTEAKLSDYANYLQGNRNFIIDGEFVDKYNKLYLITSVGNKYTLLLPNVSSDQEKHKLVNFYTYTKKTYAVYQNTKLLKSFYNVNNAKQLASMNLKTSIKTLDGKVIWKNENRYAVYLHEKLLYTFADRKTADKFANVQAGRRVLDLKTNKNVYFKSNANFRYSVYLGKDKLDIFTSSNDAIKFAKLNSKRIVKDEKTKKIIYPNKK
ncbi:hypothetical protein V7056_03405 [Bacillus sp. JJ664]